MIMLGAALHGFSQDLTTFLNGRRLEITRPSTARLTPTNLQNLASPATPPNPFAAGAREYLLKHISHLQYPGADLTLLHAYQSPIGHHFLFQQIYSGREVYKGNIKINVDHTGKVLSIGNNLFDGAVFGSDQYPAITTAPGEKQIWAFDGRKLIPSVAKKIRNALTASVEEEIIPVDQTTPIHINSFTLGSGKKDTLIPAKIFNPDPLTSVEAIYGDPWPDHSGRWVDSGGVDYPILNAQRKDVFIPLTLDGDTFRMENKYAVITDIHEPFIPPYKSTSSDFNFTRSQSAFEEEMCLFHISKYQDYLHSIGFDSLVNYQIQVDASGWSDDNSKFEYGVNPPYLRFGTGFVDDAEDADVINHEYTHAVGFSIAPFTTDGSQRMSIEEGNCDFVATRFSRAISQYNWNWFANWDGYPWSFNKQGGRNAGSSKRYADTTGNYYVDCSIWSSCMNDIADQVGRDMTMKLLLTSIASYQNNMTMPEACELLLEADSVLNQKANWLPIINVCSARGFRSINVGTSESYSTLKTELLNSAGFAAGSGSLTIHCPATPSFTVHFYDLNGDKILSAQATDNRITIAPALFKQGIYFVEVAAETGRYYTKVIRY